MSRDTRHHEPSPRWYPPIDWDLVSRIACLCAVVVTLTILAVIYWPS